MAVLRTGVHEVSAVPVRAVPSLGTCLVLGWAFLLPVQFSTGSGLRLAPSDVLIGAYAVLAVSSLRQVARVWSGWFVALVLVIWWALARAGLQQDGASQHAVLDKAVGILVLVVTYRCLVNHVSTLGRLRSLLRAFLVGALANAVLGLVAFLLERASGASLPLVNAPYETSRLTGLLVDPNAFGGLLATALVLHLATAAGGVPLLTGRLGVAADLVLPTALALTFSRSAWIGALCGLLALGAADARLLRGALVRLLPVAVLLPVLLASLPGSAVLAERPSQVAARVEIASSALADLGADPLNGIGLGVYEQEHGVIVHNTALWFLTEMGLVGLVVFAGFMMLHLRRATWLVRRGPPELWVAGAGLLGGLFAGLGLSVGIEAFYQRYWWLVFAGLAAACSLAARAERP